jgi:hypothetical protein
LVFNIGHVVSPNREGTSTSRTSKVTISNRLALTFLDEAVKTHSWPVLRITKRMLFSRAKLTAAIT